MAYNVPLASHETPNEICDWLPPPGLRDQDPLEIANGQPERVLAGLAADGDLRGGHPFHIREQRLDNLSGLFDSREASV